ncbi:hypothetical protein Vse01_37020 [Micromonospora sediminimaris]|uniref:Uncharacterized protein n=1 Tax=Micromonospora sediminimaris TaxID=547162 RepID=A0A9W5UTZ9_9ACTN|nr:hypothetical protein Vse01_37020 [Micromonospora sediminimaris]
MRARMAGVHDGHLMTDPVQRGDDMGTDETGSAGDEYVGHGPTLEPAGRRRRP